MLSPDDIHVLNTWLTIGERWEHRAKLIRQTVERAFELRTMKGIDTMPEYAFNSQGVDASYGGGGSQLPIGKHPVVISGSALKPTQGNNGGYIEFTLTAIDGPARGQTQTDRLNVYNQSAQAVEIANKQLAAYCAVTGVPAFNATEQLHDKPFMVDIGPQKGDRAQYHEVKALYDMQGNEPGKAGAGPMMSNNGGQQPNNGFAAQGGGQIPPNNQGGGQQFGGQPQGGHQGGGFGQQGQGQPQQGGFGGQQPQSGQAGNFGAQGGGFGGQGQPDQSQGQPQQGSGAAGWSQGGGQQGGGTTPGWGQR